MFLCTRDGNAPLLLSRRYDNDHEHEPVVGGKKTLSDTVTGTTEFAQAMLQADSHNLAERHSSSLSWSVRSRRGHTVQEVLHDGRERITGLMMLRTGSIR